MRTKLLRKQIPLLLVAALLFCSCGSNADTDVPELLAPISLNSDTAAAAYSNIYDLEYHLGNVYANSESAAFTVNGQIREVCVAYGQNVAKGDTLAYLDDTALQEKLTACKQSIENARDSAAATNRKLEIDRTLLQMEMTDLQNSGASSYDIAKKQIALDRLELTNKQNLYSQSQTLAALQQTLEQLNAQQANFILTAPCDGSVVWISDKAGVGRTVLADYPLFQVLDVKNPYIETEYITLKNVEVASRMYAMIGAEEYALDAIPLSNDELISATLSGKTLSSRFSFQQADASVPYGATTIVCLQSNYKENVLCVPTNSVFKDAGGNYVYKIENGQKVKCSVTIGVKTALRTEIISGISEGDEVYVQG